MEAECQRQEIAWCIIMALDDDLESDGGMKYCIKDERKD